MLNKQPIEKQNFIHGEISYVKIFKTIQGEGPFSGFPAIFLRLAGCNLQCPYCDTDYTSNKKTAHVTEVIEQIAKIEQPPHLVVITGGEPFRQDISILCNTLILLGYAVQIESNGTLAPPENLSNEVCIVVSPKTTQINERMMQRLNFLKYVIDSAEVDKEDGLPIKALNHSVKEKVYRTSRNDVLIYVTPMAFDHLDGEPKEIYLQQRYNRNVQAAKNSSFKHGYIFQLQIHKIIGVE